MKHAKILVADDERAITEGLSAILTDEGYEVVVAHDGQQALDKIDSDDFGVVLADLKMPKRDGLAILKQLQHKPTAPECIIITGQGTIDSAVAAMRQGAYDYIEKPLNAEKLNRLKALIPKALERHNIQQRNRELTSTIEGLTHYGELTGQSEEMRAVYQVIEAVAQSTASVFILGESGTGKELVARALHANSDRAQGIFFALNCAALPKDILENELFGHEKGAFTGSTNEKAGAFELADGGTLFLDEVGELPMPLQAKLLTALEDGEIRRLGAERTVTVNTRIIAAAGQDLEAEVAEKRFRRDLYHRLLVLSCRLPPLRERYGDVEFFLDHFLDTFTARYRRPIRGFDTEALARLSTHDWPGNVRELAHAVEAAVLACDGGLISADHLPSTVRRGSGLSDQTAPTQPNGPAQRYSFHGPPGEERARIEEALRRFRGNKTRAAAALGMGRNTLRLKMRSFGLDGGNRSD
jgi:two-component system, NtrC family, response regulator HydG